MAGIDFSKFSQDFKAKFEKAITDKKIYAEEFQEFSAEDQAELSRQLASTPGHIGDIIVIQNAYKSKQGTLEFYAGADSQEGKVELSQDTISKYPNAGKFGNFNKGVVTILDKDGKVLKDSLGNPIKFDFSTDLEIDSTVDNVQGGFETIEGENFQRTNRRFAIALIRSMYDKVIVENQNMLEQLELLNASLWREGLGMGIQKIADSIDADQKAITATTAKKIEQMVEERDKICDALEKQLDNPSGFSDEFSKLVGSNFSDMNFDKLRETCHNKENEKDDTIRYNKTIEDFKEMYPDNNVTKYLEGNFVTKSLDKMVKLCDSVADILVMFWTTGGIGGTLGKASMKGFANSSKFFIENIGKKNYKEAIAQLPKLSSFMAGAAHSAPTMSAFEGGKALINSATNGEDLTADEILSRTIDGFIGGAEMGVEMAGLQTFAIAPIMNKLSPVLGKMTGASSKIKELLKKNGEMSLEDISKVYDDCIQTTRGKIAQEGLHLGVSLPVMISGFTGIDSAKAFMSNGDNSYKEDEFREQLLKEAKTQEERVRISAMNSFELKVEFVKRNFQAQLEGMTTIEGVSLALRRFQAARLAGQAVPKPVNNLLGAKIKTVEKDGKPLYEVVQENGKTLKFDMNDGKTVSKFSSPERAIAAYQAMCVKIVSEFKAELEKADKKAYVDKLRVKTTSEQKKFTQNQEKIDNILSKFNPNREQKVVKELLNDKTLSYIEKFVSDDTPPSQLMRFLDVVNRRDYDASDLEQIIKKKQVIDDKLINKLEFKNLDRFKNITLEDFSSLSIEERKEFINAFISIKYNEGHLKDLPDIAIFDEIKNLEKPQMPSPTATPTEKKEYLANKKAFSNKIADFYSNTLNKMLETIPRTKNDIPVSVNRLNPNANLVTKPALTTAISKIATEKVNINGHNVKVGQIKEDGTYFLHNLEDESIPKLEAYLLTDSDAILCTGFVGGKGMIKSSGNRPGIIVSPKNSMEDLLITAKEDVSSGFGAIKNYFNIQNLFLNKGNEYNNYIPKLLKEKLNLSAEEYNVRLEKLKNLTHIDDIETVDKEFYNAIKTVISENPIFESIMRPNIEAIYLPKGMKISENVASFAERYDVPILFKDATDVPKTAPSAKLYASNVQITKTPIQTQQRLIKELETAKNREDFSRITQEIKNLPKTEEYRAVRQRLGGEYFQRYNEWKALNPSIRQMPSKFDKLNEAKADTKKADNIPNPLPQVTAEETKPKGKLAVEENNVKSTKELIEKAQTTNPTENVKNKVISEVAKDIKDEGMRLNTPESLDAELAEAEQNPNALVDNMEAFNLVINGNIGNVLKAQYDNASKVFTDIAKKYSSELDQLEKQYGNDKKLFVEKFTEFLADKLGVKGIEPEIVFRDTGDADGVFDWPTGKLVVNNKLNNSKDIQSMIAHEFVHIMQFKDMIANKGAKKAISSILMHTNNGKYITAEAVNLAKFNGEDWESISAAEQQMYKEVRAEMLADEVMEANKGLVDFAQKNPISKGSLNEYLSRIYQNEYENMKTDVNSPEYYEQVIENEAYYLGSGQLGLNLKGHINFVDIQAKAPTKLNNVGISKGNLVVSYKSPYANPNTASQKSKKLMYKIIAGEVKIAELDDNYILDIWSRKHYSHIEDTPYIKEYMERFDAICEKNTITMYPGENALRTISVDCGTTDGVFSIGKPGRPAAAARCKISDLDKVNSKDLLKLVQTRVNKDKNIYISRELKDVECSDKIENSTIFVIVPDEGKELKGFDWSKTGTCQESGFGSDVFQANVDKNGLSTEVVFPSTARFTQIGKAEILPYVQNSHGKEYEYDIKIVFVKPIY